MPLLVQGIVPVTRRLGSRQVSSGSSSQGLAGSVQLGLQQAVHLGTNLGATQQDQQDQQQQ